MNNLNDVSSHMGFNMFKTPRWCCEFHHRWSEAFTQSCRGIGTHGIGKSPQICFPCHDLFEDFPATFDYQRVYHGISHYILLNPYCWWFRPMNKVVFREKTHGEFKTSDGDDFLLRNLELGIRQWRYRK